MAKKTKRTSVNEQVQRLVFQIENAKRTGTPKRSTVNKWLRTAGRLKVKAEIRDLIAA